MSQDVERDRKDAETLEKMKRRVIDPHTGIYVTAEDHMQGEQFYRYIMHCMAHN